MKSPHRFPYDWALKNGYPADGITATDYKVFGTFICGGGSTMGYKLAGLKHLGGVEIDVQMAKAYKQNHSPKYLYNEDIRLFNARQDLPKELFELDILDGSPPCSTFSTAGSREDAWGKEKMFKEGQAKQVLDDLVYVYCDTIVKLRPKVFVLENVTGIIKGNAKAYSKQIVQKMQTAGYAVQVFCLNAASMGVPQMRERVFFVGYDSKRFSLPPIKLAFNEPAILFSKIKDYEDRAEKNKTGPVYELWEKRIPSDMGLGDTAKRVLKKETYFSRCIFHENRPLSTITANNDSFLDDIYRHLNESELKKGGTFPSDYDFCGQNPGYMIGMSVPPVMTAQIAYQIRVQWLEKTRPASK